MKYCGSIQAIKFCIFMMPGFDMPSAGQITSPWSGLPMKMQGQMVSQLHASK